MGIAFRTGDGARVKIGTDEIREIQDEVAIITGDAFLGVYGANGRGDADETRFCKWEGQSSDGRKYRDMLNHEPFPFEGATDSRMPLVDMLIEENVDLLTMATTIGMGGPGVMGITGLDAEQAGMMDDLLTWEFRNGIGAAWTTEMERLANYVLGDNPGLGVMMAYWVQRKSVVPKRLKVADVAGLLEKLPSGDAGQWFVQAVENKQVDDVAGVLGDLLAGIVTSAAALKTMAQELVEDGETQFPVEIVGENHAMVRALRPYEDIFWRGSVRDIQDARVIIRREWMSIGEAFERAAADGWKDEFLKKLLGKPGGFDQAGGGMYGVTMFPSNDKSPGTVLDSSWQVKAEAYQDQVEICTAYFQGTDERGVTGWYYTTLNAGIDYAAHDGQPIGYDHGKAPFVLFQAEYLRDNCCDSRGMSERFGSQQNLLKMQMDMRTDRTQLNTIPPMTGPMRLAGQKFTVEPGGYIEQPRLGMVQWMPMSGGGAAESDGALENLWRFVNHYAKRSGEDVPQELVQMRRQAMVNKWLAQCAEVVKMVGQLAVQFHTDEEIMAICDVEENPFARDVMSIRGMFHLQLFVDVSDLDKELLLKKAEMIFKYVLPLDTDQEFDRGRLRDVIMARIDPALARVARRKAAESIGDQQKAEKDAFAKIAAGVEPEYLEGDANYMARLRELDDLMANNQEDIARNWTPRKKELLEKRRQNLAFGLQQQENAVTGRRGVEEGSVAEG